MRGSLGGKRIWKGRWGWEERKVRGERVERRRVRGWGGGVKGKKVRRRKQKEGEVAKKRSLRCWEI